MPAHLKDGVEQPRDSYLCGNHLSSASQVQRPPFTWEQLCSQVEGTPSAAALNSSPSARITADDHWHTSCPPSLASQSCLFVAKQKSS
ncbi:hypothetical protein ABBQ38_012328 [Trebouxia sp. C0009 RCD-2024]